MASYSLAYGNRENIPGAIQGGIIPPGTIILTEDTNELFFYDLNSELKSYEERYKFESLQEAQDWVGSYDCGGQIFSIHHDGKCNIYVVNYDNTLVPLITSNFVQEVKDPTEKDTNYELFTHWLNVNDNAIFILANIVDGKALWKEIGVPQLVKGKNVTTYGNNSTAFGYSTLAGQRGYKLISLSGVKDEIGYYTLDSVDGIKVGDAYSVQGDAYGGNYGKVVEINTETNTVTVDRYFETTLASSIYSWKNLFFIDTKPGIGTTENGGSGATAEGYCSIALKVGSHAEGESNAFAPYSHSENKGKAIGYGSHAEGYSTANDYYSHAEGENSEANGRSAHAEGNQTKALARAAHAEGESTEAIGVRAHSEGFRSKAKEEAAHSEGLETEARGKNSHAEGSNTIAEQSSSHAEGAYTLASKQASHAEGLYSESTGTASHAEGYKTIASGNYSHAEGKFYEKDGVITRVEASGEAAHAEGLGTLASSAGAHAEGELSKATGYASHAEGHSTASSSFSHSEGTSKATGPYAHAEGAATTASASFTHSEGWGTIASSEAQHVQGKYNKEESDKAFIIGNGTSSKRSNAMTVDWGGNVKIAGTLTDGKGNTLSNIVERLSKIESSLGI